MRYIIILVVVFMATNCYASHYEYDFRNGRYVLMPDDKREERRGGFSEGYRAGAEVGGSSNPWVAAIQSITKSTKSQLEFERQRRLKDNK